VKKSDEKTKEVVLAKMEETVKDIVNKVDDKIIGMEVLKAYITYEYKAYAIKFFRRRFYISVLILLCMIASTIVGSFETPENQMKV
jgi:hypothetical protein